MEQLIVVLTNVLVALAGVVSVFLTIRFSRLAVSRYRLSRVQRRPVLAKRALLWRDPGPVESLDLGAGPGGPDGAPRPPFTFVEEHSAGTNPCVTLRDARGLRWRVKWGPEAQPEAFATRIAWAAGYLAEATYFVREGRIEGCGPLSRAAACVTDDGQFVDARFEIEEIGVRKLFDEQSWAWDDNPFVGTRELAGLKIVVMLLSNWDAKDVRDIARGSNTAIFEYRHEDGTLEAHYLIMDWGASMGRWGGLLTRSKWDAEGYEEQTPTFTTGVRDGIVTFGYSGQRTDDVAAGITVEDARWVHARLGRLGDEQIRAALAASGAEGVQLERFARSLRARIDELGRVGEQ